jgi:hypothetical protein
MEDLFIYIFILIVASPFIYVLVTDNKGRELKKALHGEKKFDPYDLLPTSQQIYCGLANALLQLFRS